MTKIIYYNPLCINKIVKKVVQMPKKAYIYQTIKYMNNFQANYNKILEVLRSITEKEQFLNCYKIR